jgi:hypothetical protein
MSDVPTSLTPRLRINNIDQWGRLVKSWATRQDYISQDYPDQPPRDYSTRDYPKNPPPPGATTLDIDARGTLKPWALPPMSVVSIPGANGAAVPLAGAVALTGQEFKTLLKAAKVSVKEMPTQYKHVVILQGSVDTMVVRLPPRDILQGSEDDLLNGTRYEIPEYYTEYFKPGPQPNTVVFVPPTTRAEIMELHANRIGEYTLNSCN